MKIKDLKAALEKLGVKPGTKVKTVSAGKGRSKVFVGGKYFGIFDYVRKTFVD